MTEKSITVKFRTSTGATKEKTLTGSRVGYDPVSDTLIKIWADRETYIVPQNAVESIHMQD